MFDPFRCHWYVKVIPPPDQVPSSVERIDPTFGVPVTTGATVFAGATATVIVFEDACVAEPPVFVTVTLQPTACPPSAVTVV